MKATEQYFHVVLFIVLHKVIITFNLVDALECDHSNEIYWEVLSGSDYAAQRFGSDF